MSVKISTSIMCSTIQNVPAYLKTFEENKVDSIHFDVMDGHYVQNIMLGTTHYKDIKAMTMLPVDIHLMCLEPEKFLDYFNPMPGDRVCFHPETCAHSYRLLQAIRNRGLKSGLVLNPGTPVNHLEEYSDVLDYVLLMTVNPGFTGQMMVPGALDKIKRVRAIIDTIGITDLFVDGNTTFKNAALMKKAGANGFIVGTSSILKGLEEFNRDYPKYRHTLEQAAE